MVILATRSILTPEQFDLWDLESTILDFYCNGWRFVFNRKTWMNLVFAKAKSEGNTSTNPLKKRVGNRLQLKICFTSFIS
jgi:hypothetical protein